MIKGLTELEVFKVIRPVIGDYNMDEYGFPIVNRTDITSLEWNKIRACTLQNASSKTDNKNTLLLMFNYDKRLLSLWNEPLKHIGLFQTYAAIATPDFSIYPNMNINDIRHNIYKARWLGKTWQNYHCRVLPTIGWSLPDTYNMCFSAVEKGSPVVISTLGCSDNQEVFLNGFNEMKLRISPPIIIVFGDMIPGMTGTFVNYRYKDTFSSKYEQLCIEEYPQVFTIKEEM